MWLGELSGFSRTWSNSEVTEISEIMNKCNASRPFEIHRKIRTLDHIKFWKGSEFSTFLHYVGIVVLKNHISNQEYELFLKLYCAVTICSTEAYTHYLPVARNLFIDFIENHIDIYGEQSITMNIHNLSHVVDDIENFGPLNILSAYEFENYLHDLKLNLKPGDKPLEQIARRILEGISSSKEKGISLSKPKVFVK